MAFGQQQGPPASARQVQELLVLLQEAGHSDFRDARGPMGFTQRQAAGKFTRTEADALLEQLRDQEPMTEAQVEGQLALGDLTITTSMTPAEAAEQIVLMMDSRGEDYSI